MSEFSDRYPLCASLGLDSTAGDLDTVWAVDVERLLTFAPVAYGFGDPGGSFTISSDLKGPGTCEMKARIVLPERLEKPETAADLLKTIVNDYDNGRDPNKLMIERCKRALGL